MPAHVPTSPWSGANGGALSADGKKVVAAEQTSPVRAYSWDATTGTESPLTGLSLAPTAANANADVVFAGSYRWTAATGAVRILGVTGSVAASDATGTIAVGAGGNLALRWTPTTGAQSLSNPGITSSVVTLPSPTWQVLDVRATATSADGKIIVGTASVRDVAGFVSGTFDVAVIWDATGNGYTLDYYARWSSVPKPPLGQYWAMQSAVGISADGKTVVGRGVDDMGRSVGYIVDMP